MRRCKQILWIIGIDTLAALIQPIFLWANYPRISHAALLLNFRISFVYAQTIGGLAFWSASIIWHPIQRFHRLARWTLLMATFVAVAMAGSLFAGLVFLVLGWMPASRYWLQFWGSMKLCIIITLLIGIAMEVHETLQSRLNQTTLKLQQQELERERALKAAAEARLASLQSRVHPHFLFNALNSISSLIQEDPVRADRLVEKMAALLRFSLDSSQEGLVRLEDEIKIVSDYLEIEKARFADRLRYNIVAPDEVRDAAVPALSIQTLVENSVKHAISPVRAGGEIEISAELVSGNLQIKVADTGKGFALDNIPAGHGLDNLQARLVHLFGEKAKLATAASDGKNAVIMTMPRMVAHARISG